MYDTIQTRQSMASYSEQAKQAASSCIKDPTELVLESLNDRHKAQIVTTDFLKVEAEYWKEQFEDEKKQLIPFARCRICE